MLHASHNFVRLYLRQSEKKLLSINISSIRLHNMANFGSLAAVWGTPANFNGFREFASLLQRRRSVMANQTLHDVWLFPGLVHYMHIFVGSCPWRNFALCKIHFTLRPSLAFSYIGSVTARHFTSEREPGCNMVQCNYGTFAEGATYIRLGGLNVGHWPTF